MVYSARVPSVKEVRCKDIFEFMELPHEMEIDGRIFRRSPYGEIEGFMFIVHYVCYQ